MNTRSAICWVIGHTGDKPPYCAYCGGLATPRFFRAELYALDILMRMGRWARRRLRVMLGRPMIPNRKERRGIAARKRRNR